MLIVALLLSILIGVSLGVLGGGGSILTVPILVYAIGMPPKQAIATSLFVVAVTSAAGMISHARAGRVRWRTGVIFGMAGMSGAYAGGRIAQYIPGNWLLIAFGLMMVATAIAMLRPKKKAAKAEAAPADDKRELPIFRVLLDGVIVGLVTGLVGAGGGFLVVPALALLGGLPMGVAVGTSLLVISMKSAAGFVGYMHSVPVDWTMALIVSGAAIVGSLIGGKLAGKMSQETLRKSFGWFVVVMAIFVLGKQLPAGFVSNLFASGLGWALVGAVALAIGGTVAYRFLAARRGDAEEVLPAAE
ncbi:MAG: sulfite exporter TauE/SafE family protein [Myxococcales bacterium]|nr:sulfite exporter TauE/SafE family protein [Myxococcales bacterium]MCB9581496.1 sulfite exporter TauE/SafE family protein [Polyangiaceae bacterium]